MARSPAVQLAESLDLVQGNRELFLDFTFRVHGPDPGEMERGIEHHGSMAGGEHKAITVGPERAGGIVVQEILPERIHNRRQAHRSAGMSRVGLLHRVDRERSDGVDTKLIEGVLLAHGVSGAGVRVPAIWAQALDAPPGKKASKLYCKREPAVRPVLA